MLDVRLPEFQSWNRLGPKAGRPGDTRLLTGIGAGFKSSVGLAGKVRLAIEVEQLEPV